MHCSNAWPNAGKERILDRESTLNIDQKCNILRKRTLEACVNGGDDVDQLGEGVVQLFVVQVGVKGHPFRVVLLRFHHFEGRLPHFFQQS